MKRKIAVSVPEELVADVQRAVREGDAPSVSAYVTDALREKAKKGTLDELLDEMDRIYGPPSEEVRKWVQEVDRRADEYWTRVRSSRSNEATNAPGRSSRAPGGSSSRRRSSPRSGGTARGKPGSRSSSGTTGRSSRSSTSTSRSRRASSSVGQARRTSPTRASSSPRGATPR